MTGLKINVEIKEVKVVVIVGKEVECRWQVLEIYARDKKMKKKGENYLESIVLQEMCNTSILARFSSGTTVNNDGQRSGLTGFLARSDLDTV